MFDECEATIGYTGEKNVTMNESKDKISLYSIVS